MAFNYRFCPLLLIALFASSISFSQPADSSLVIKNNNFILNFTQLGLSGLMQAGDVFPTNYIEKGKAFGTFNMVYKTGQNGSWKTLLSASVINQQKATGNSIEYTAAKQGPDGIKVNTVYTLADKRLTYKFTINNTSKSAVRIGDLSLPINYNSLSGENPKEIFEQRVIKHSFISGDGSYLFFERPTGVAPYLVMIPLPGTHLEYFDMGVDTDQMYNAYIYSEAAAQRLKGNWRQKQTGVTLTPGSSATYGFKFRWVNSYQQIRDVLYEEGLPDINVIPGMTVPNDLFAEFSIRSKQPINEIAKEFPAETQVIPEGKKGTDTYLYKVKFARLGENKLTITYGGKYKTYLEFFSTQPLSVLYKKRASFLVNSQQHKDSSKWYNGVFSQWDMRNQVLRGPDNTDGFDGWWGYVLTCDDPGLGKAPFLAAKNLHYPVQSEIDALEYYIKNFVWGKLQRTDKEVPYPYGIYGTPSWYIDRDIEKRKKITKDNLDKEHIWRSYDYPHIMMLYFHMYQIASMYPQMTHYLDKKGYLVRAMETAKAYFTYPYQILPWYETYKWGCYNELLIPDLIAELNKQGYNTDAAWLQKEWEKKVKYFIYDDPYPYRSEYSIDATAFESSHAFAAYAIHNTMLPDSNLWFDKKYKRWYSHPNISPADAPKFMEREIAANIACRGWLENAYYLKGSDFRGSSDRYLLSYMAAMGGWAITDYALNYAQQPENYLQLGYASYLSSFALMNTGTAKSNYGYWYPGVKNDGATGWAFEPLKHTTNWIRKEQDRGAWFYDGEIDLGYGGALRTAATIVTTDPVFGLFAYGGLVNFKDNVYTIDPKDGLQQRFYYIHDGSKFKLELNRDGFTDKPGAIKFNSTLTTLSLQIENRTHDAHQTTLNLTGMAAGKYRLSINGKQVNDIDVEDKQTDVTIQVGSGVGYVVTLDKI